MKFQAAVSMPPSGNVSTNKAAIKLVYMSVG